MAIRFLCVLGLLCAASAACAAESDLPRGNQKPPVSCDWFPSRMHAVVWRNWDLVPTARIAETIRATPEQVESLAASMGLGDNHPVPEKYKAHSYKTVLRHNWHLLPYDQLLRLLDMPAEELAFKLHEDDFLFIKLGRFKPKCEAVIYSKPTPEQNRRAEEIAALVEKHFGSAVQESGEPRYQFIEDYSRPINPFDDVPEPRSEEINPFDDESEPRSEEPRYLYSYFTVFGDPLLQPAIDPYPDRLLAEYAERGVNGVWMHVVLRQLAPGGATFPEWGDGHEKRLANLNKLVKRAARHGIKIYLYMNEPRAMPRAFFKKHPELAGVTRGELTTICTSDPRTRTWLRDSLEYVFTNAPGLGGVFTITASENLTSCASHGLHEQCPHCQDRSAAEIIAEVNATIEAGVHAAAPEARVICWDWGWNRHRDAADHIALLPDDVYLMSVSEWALPITRGGVSSTIGEYSISAVGPGPRATQHWKLAKQRGLKAVAKMQINNTWELSAVPFLPVGDLVAEHADNLAELDVDGAMLSWSLGGAPSPNVAIVTSLLDNPEATPEEVLNRVAQKRYGKAAAPAVRKAWTAFSEAFQQYPYGGSVVYRAPQQFGPSNVLFSSPTGFKSTMIGFPYDDLDGWRGPYPPEIFAEQFEKVNAGWQDGLKHFDEAIGQSDDAHVEILQIDRRLAEAAGIHFASVANQARSIIARDRLIANPNDAGARKAMRAAVGREIALATRLYQLVKRDGRIGFEASNGYYYTPLDLVEKVVNCDWVTR